jgi:sporulation protein YlmC with PRC-barrel domain
MNRSQPTQRSEAALPARAIHLTELLHTPLVNRDGHRVGRVIDVVADRCDGRDLEITGLVAGIDGRQVFIPMKRLTLAADAAVIGSVDEFGEPYRRRPSELLLVADVLGRRLLDVRITKLVRAREIELVPYSGGWTVAGVDVEWGGWWHHLTGRLNRHRARRTWDALETLTTTEDGPLVGPFRGGVGPAEGR